MPRRTFTVDLHQHALLLATMLTVSWIVAPMVARLRWHTAQATAQALRSDQLREFAEAQRAADEPAVQASRQRPMGPGTGRHEEQPAWYLPLRGLSGGFGAALIRRAAGDGADRELRDHLQALLHNLKHNQVLHARNVILTVVFHEVPWVSMDRRVHMAPLGHGFWRVTLNFGFMNTPDVPRALELTQSHGLHIPVFETSYFLSREAVVPTPGGGMANWRERLFAAMSRNAGGVAEFFRLPNNAVLEVGTRVEI